MLRTSEITITRNFTSNKPLGLTFKRDGTAIVFAKSKSSLLPNRITLLLPGCNPLYILGYDTSKQQYQCIEFDDDFYSEDLKNVITEKMDLFYMAATPTTPFIIYYDIVVSDIDLGVTTKITTKIASGLSSNPGYKIRLMGINRYRIFKDVEYKIFRVMDSNNSIKCSITLLTSIISNSIVKTEDTQAAITTLSDLKTMPMPVCKYHYLVSTGSINIPTKLITTEVEGKRRIKVVGTPQFLEAYGITNNSILVGVVTDYMSTGTNKSVLDVIDLRGLPKDTTLDAYLDKLEVNMTTNTLLMLTSTDENAAKTANDAQVNLEANPKILETAATAATEAAKAVNAVYEYIVTIKKKEIIGISFNPKNNKVTTDQSINPYNIINDSELVRIEYNDKTVELNTTNGFEKFQEFRERKEAINDTDEITFIKLHFITNDPIKAPKEPKEEKQEPNLEGGKSHKTKRHRKKSKRHRKKSRRNKKTRRRKH